VETAGTWHDMAIELTQEIGRWITIITEDTRETALLFLMPVCSSPKGKCLNLWSLQSFLISL